MLNVAGNGRGLWHDEAWLATNEHYGIGRHVLGAEDGVAHPGSTRPEAPRCAPPVRSGRHEAAPSQPPMLPSPALQPASGLAAWLCAWIQLSKVQAEQTTPNLRVVLIPTLLSL
jgi:hypothetical protein